MGPGVLTGDIRHPVIAVFDWVDDTVIGHVVIVKRHAVEDEITIAETYAVDIVLYIPVELGLGGG